jgi:2-keto-4-pentenoate hydratase/2-oxohepta-3-ene-1,7-dioic acid hydratase in catechol pathway
LVYHPLAKIENEEMVDETLQHYHTKVFHSHSLSETAATTLFYNECNSLVLLPANESKKYNCFENWSMRQLPCLISLHFKSHIEKMRRMNPKNPSNDFVKATDVKNGTADVCPYYML